MPDDDSNSSPHQTPTNDPVLDAMGGAAGALRRFADHTTDVLDAFDRAAGMRETGSTYRAGAEQDRLSDASLCAPYRDLLKAGSTLRRRKVRPLYEGGMRKPQLGRLLGVPRQRIAVLLDDKRKADTSTTDD